MAIIGNYSDLWKGEKGQFRVGDEIWACAFRYSHEKDGIELKCEPVKGILACGKAYGGWGGKSKLTEEQYSQFMADTENDLDKRLHPASFVPYGSKGTPVFSKAVESSSRWYATDEESSKELYNSLIGRSVNYLQGIIDNLESLKV